MAYAFNDDKSKSQIKTAKLTLGSDITVSSNGSNHHLHFNLPDDCNTVLGIIAKNIIAYKQGDSYTMDWRNFAIMNETITNAGNDHYIDVYVRNYNTYALTVKSTSYITITYI